MRNKIIKIYKKKYFRQLLTYQNNKWELSSKILIGMYEATSFKLEYDFNLNKL